MLLEGVWHEKKKVSLQIIPTPLTEMNVTLLEAAGMVGCSCFCFCFHSI